VREWSLSARAEKIKRKILWINKTGHPTREVRHALFSANQKIAEVLHIWKLLRVTKEMLDALYRDLKALEALIQLWSNQRCGVAQQQRALQRWGFLNKKPYFLCLLAI